MIRKFKEDLNHIENGALLLDSIEEINQIYYYTKIDDLKDIVEEKNISVAHSYFIRGGSENEYTYQLIIETLNDMLNSESDYTVVKILDLIKADIELVVKREVGMDNIKVRSNEGRPSEFVLTFSLNKDSVSVWSKFPGDSGYNLGFNLSEFLYTLDQFTEFNYIPGKVIYDKERQKEIITKRTQQFIEIFLKHRHDFNQEMLNLFLIRYTSSVRLYSNFFKNPSFYADEEFRIIFYNYRHYHYVVPHYRIKNNMLLPTINTFSQKLSNFQFPLNSITVGPTNYTEIAKESLAYYLVDFGFDLSYITLYSSTIPTCY